MKILIVDDAKDTQLLLAAVLSKAGYTTFAAFDGQAGFDMLDELQPDLAIVDLIMPGMDGLSFTAQALDNQPGMSIIMLTAHSSLDTAIEALKIGAVDYLTKPIDRQKLLHAIKQACERKELLQENRLLKAELHKHEDDFATETPQIKTILQHMDKIAATDVTILITGENGTGKEVLANYIHRRSARASRPFVPVNCAALSENILESELFGHAKGAFTGAHDTHAGYFEAADKATLFLDEVAELSPQMQVKLLRVLQNKEYSRVGETRTRKTDVRIIAATNRDMAELLKSGHLREDFYYRLNVFRVYVPPLRNRPKDIMMLFAKFVRQIAIECGKSVPQIAPEVAPILKGYYWPGNIRELRNIAERMTLLCDGDIISELLPEEFHNASKVHGEQTQSNDYRECRRQFEINFIMLHLEHNKGNIAETAREIGLHPVALRQKIAKLDIDTQSIKERFRT